MRSYCLPPVGFLRIDTQAEPLKLCWMSERVTGPLYFQGRSSGISLPLTLWAEMVQRVERICHRWACRWSRGPGRVLDPARQENKTGFLAETGRLFTLYNPGMRTCASSSHRVHVGKLFRWGASSEITATPLQWEKRKQDRSFCFSIRGWGELKRRELA